MTEGRRHVVEAHPLVFQPLRKLFTRGENQENNGETHLYPEWIRDARP